VTSIVTVHVQAQDDQWVCEVGVEHAGRRTHHTVTVSKADLERWADGSEPKDVESLVARSFDFLLERESPSAILASFDLTMIQRYFPEYDRAFSRR
jgi:hypothetical protein